METNIRKEPDGSRVVTCCNAECRKPLYRLNASGELTWREGEGRVYPWSLQLGNCMYVACSRECCVSIVQTELEENFHRGYPLW